jgi:tripartite ATP-independent transporter DctM subunit
MIAVAFLVLFALLFLRVPIAVATGLVGLVGLSVVQSGKAAFAQLGIIASETVLTYDFAVIPLFIIMGAFIARSGIADELFEACYAVVGHFRGGLAMTTVFACGGFGAVSGSSLATAATMSRIAFPAMKQRGYSNELASGSIAAGGTLGILIPPSIALVFYGVMTESDIGDLFAAGLLPGIIGIFLYAAAVLWVVLRNPAEGPAGEPMAWADRVRALRGVWATLVLFGVVMGGIYGGIFSPTESAGIGAAGALLLAIARGRASFEMVKLALKDALGTSVALMLILVGAMLFAALVNAVRLPSDLADMVTSWGLAPLAVIFFIVAIYLVLGCVLESISMMLLTVPVFYPLVAAMGYDLIWFGIVVVVVVEISLITPPIGLNVFVLKSMLKEVELSSIFKGVFPFLVADLVRALLVILIPALSLTLPALFP